MDSRTTVLARVSAILAGIPLLAGQSVPPPPATEATVVLSPFILTGGKDIGYRSTNSLGGSRLNTDYKDIASRLEVMTPDFLSDIGAFTLKQALNYSGNTESPAETWAVGAGTGDGFLGTSTASMVPSRTRGLGRTTPTHNYFPTVLPYDSYNSFERGLTIASGPNPGLFALGNASGIANTDPNRPRLHGKSGTLRTVADSLGSVRSDLNDTTTLEIAGNQVSTPVSDLNRPIYSREQWYFDPFVSFRSKLSEKLDFQVQLNVYNATNVRDLDLVAVYASTARRLDVKDPRFTYYGWKDPLSLPLTVRVQDPISFQLTAKFGF